MNTKNTSVQAATHIANRESGRSTQPGGYVAGACNAHVSDEDQNGVPGAYALLHPGEDLSDFRLASAVFCGVSANRDPP